MRILYRLRALARSWFRPRELDAELDEELRFHLERQTRAFSEAGMAPEEARRAAALELGGFAQIRELASAPGRASRVSSPRTPPTVRGCCAGPRRSPRPAC